MRLDIGIMSVEVLESPRGLANRFAVEYVYPRLRSGLYELGTQ